MSLTRKAIVLAIGMALAGSAVAAPDLLAADRALSLLRANPAAGHVAGADSFIVRDVIVDADGSEHARFDRSYAGLPVIGGDLVVHSRGGAFKSVSQTRTATLKLGTRPTLALADAIVRAGAEFGSDFLGNPGGTLVVYARDPSVARLAWHINLQGVDESGNPSDMSFIVDARNGKVLDRWSNIETIVLPCTSPSSAAGTGKTLYSGNVGINAQHCNEGGYQLKDLARGGAYTVNMTNHTSGGTIFTDADDSWGNNSTSDTVSAGADAHFGVARTWDYYKNVHGRNGIGNDGKGAQGQVHYGVNYVNAAWSDFCFCMRFGDGDSVTYGPLVAMDVAGHEMSHGVTARTAKLTYSGESGGLNEANSDIMGTMVEFFANNTLDTPDYLIGEEIFISNPGNTKALRWLFDPHRDGHSPNCYALGIGQLNVHYSSGPANHFYYLLAEGTVARTYSGVNHTSTTCNGTTLAGIGRAKAEKIWYRALTVYMTSTSKYHDARVATINAANDLYGASSAEASAVAKTWTAVSVN
jgi:Zn-dependent metalloprotease